jgi:hypothetical protein
VPDSKNEFSERLVDLLLRTARFAEQFMRGLRKLVMDARPALAEFVAALERIESSPPVKGYEPLLIAAGHHPLVARILAANVLRLSKQRLREIVAERKLSSAISGIVKAKVATALVISRRAQPIIAALTDYWMARPALDRAALKAGIPECASTIAGLAERAMTRDTAACRRLVEICTRLQPHLIDPRGRIPSEASVAHELLLQLRKRAYTYDAFNEAFDDPATQATCVAMNVATFDPRPARRRQKRRQSR